MGKNIRIFLGFLAIAIMLSLSSRDHKFDGSVSGKPWGNPPKTKHELEKELKIKNGWKPSNKGYNHVKHNHSSPPSFWEDAITDPYIQDMLEDETRR